MYTYVATHVLGNCGADCRSGTYSREPEMPIACLYADDRNCLAISRAFDAITPPLPGNDLPDIGGAECAKYAARVMDSRSHMTLEIVAQHGVSIIFTAVAPSNLTRRQVFARKTAKHPLTQQSVQ